MGQILHLTRVDTRASQIRHHSVVEVSDLVTCASDKTVVIIELTRFSVLSLAFLVPICPLRIDDIALAVIVRTERLPFEVVIVGEELLFVTQFDLSAFNFLSRVEQMMSIAVEDAYLHDTLILEEELLGAIGFETGGWVRPHEAHLEAHPFEIWLLTVQYPSLCHEFIGGESSLDFGLKFCANILAFDSEFSESFEFALVGVKGEPDHLLL